MMALEDTTYSASMAWVELLIAGRPELQASRYEFATSAGMLWVLVEGGDFEVLAWRAAVGGSIRPSKVVGGVWSKEILGARVHVRVSNSPVRGA